ncbi:PREDICTED: zinc finger CCCH domain-containing protein 14-like isoform X2 [Populus euphratica]|uniref:Zinc finger CCCH domain-containing protein 14-like isoform X2 n=1 Tax=Populus euphratica TaxID=75702 RepID=A0AAJ6US14_POPEU|nr:PREDICTED: zinc finger CCCH domain-containing protein 14-like isoform X2 [Populus euphratica]
MEKTESPPSDSKTAAQSPPSHSKTAAQSPPFDCHQASDHDQFASSFTSLYHSIFPPKPSQLPNSLSFTPSTNASPSSSSAADEISTENRLRQAQLILEYQDLCEHYNLSLARLQTLTNELELIRRENADLRAANSELVKLISLSSESVMQHQNRTFGNNRDGAFERRNNANNVERERVTLPKSISVRSSGFVKVNQAVSGNVSNNGGGRGSASGNSTRSRVASHLDQLVSGSMQQRVYVPGGGKKRSEEEIAAGMELEVFNQGMWKTELCNKWQETGTCPYGNHCQFAHGIGELRPVIRHPRYKTQACRMVLAGGVCPYGHRCHFRHSLTDQDRLLLGPR